MKMHAIVFGMLAVALASSTAAGAESYPSHQVRVVVPYTAGGSADLLGRIVAQKLSEKYKQAFVVENRPGAGGHIGADFVAKAAPDGYTLVVGTIPIHSAYKLYPKLGYDPARDLVAVSIIGEFPSLLIVNRDLPVKTVQDLVALSKKHPLFYGSAGVGSATHLGAALFNQVAGTTMQHVPYRGSSAAATDLMAGQIQVMFENLPTAVPLAQTGRARAIAVTSKERSPSLPDVPTAAESGEPDYSFTAWYTIAAPAGTPPAITQQLSRDIDQIVHSDALKAKWAEMGVTPVGGTVADNTAYIARQTELWTRIIQKLHITAE
ncbi:Bug family tripartite tricarboxylate transporter substrate binding protein [Achromobacter aloeverae]